MSAYPTFPELSRKPALKTKTSTNDPTLRDTMENGMESTRAKFRRRRREWSVSIDFLSWSDHAILEAFVQKIAVFGANIFLFTDERDKHSPRVLTVRFSEIPKYEDADWVQDQFRQNCTFALREV